MNDKSEVEYTLNMFREIVDSKLTTTDDELCLQFLREAPSALHNRVNASGDLYVACFCESDDLLNQWRVYSGTSGGFSLAFSSPALAPTEAPLDHLYTFRTLRRVEYNPDVQRNCLSEVVDSIVTAILSLGPQARRLSAGAIVPRCCYFLHSQLIEYLACFKHPAFSPEAEWRLCQHVEAGSGSDLRFRSGPYGVTPYLALRLSENSLPIEAVRIGPTINPDEARHALYKLLKSRGYPSVKVFGSLLPLRVGP